MRINRVSETDNGKPVGGSVGRRSRVEWLRTTKAGREAMATFSQYLAAGASPRSAAAVLGVSLQTVERWIRNGIEGRDDASIWFVETVQGALLRSVANAEVRVFKSNPLAWLRQSPAARVAGAGWSDGKASGSDDGADQLGISIGNENYDRKTKLNDRKEGGGGGRESVSISHNSKLAALYELRKAGLDLNALVDQHHTRESYIDSEVNSMISRGSYLTPTTSNESGPGSGIAATMSGNETDTGSVSSDPIHRMMRGPAFSGGTPGGNGPNDTNHNVDTNRNLSPHDTNSHSPSSSNTNTRNAPNHNSYTNPTHSHTNSHSVRSGRVIDVTPTSVGTNAADGTPVRSGTNRPSVTPDKSGSNSSSDSLLISSPNDDTIHGRVAAMLAAGRARASLSARKE